MTNRVPSTADRRWSVGMRRLVSILIVFHLLAVIYTPLTLGGGYAALLGGWSVVRHYATLMYLDHGYRFFAPEPGPTHTIQLQLGSDDLQRTIRLPDRSTTWPRLLYHRWFMVGESLSSAGDAAVAGAPQFREVQKELEEEIAAARAEIPPGSVRALEEARTENARQFANHQQVLRALVDGLKSFAAKRYLAKNARIVSRRQLIPTPLQVSRRSFDPQRLVLELDLTDLDALFREEAEEIEPPSGSDQ